MIELTEMRQTSPERFTLTFSDGRELKATLGLITDRYVHSGMSFDEAGFEELASACAYALCRARAARLIGLQPMSKKGLSDKLIQKGETPENARNAAAWLEEMGLINDAVYAGSVVRHYAAKGYGARRVQNELYRRGVPRELWEDALSEMPAQDEKMAKFIRSRLTDPSDRAQVAKVTAGLQRRGYSWSEIKAALEQFNAEAEGSQWDEA